MTSTTPSRDLNPDGLTAFGVALKGLTDPPEGGFTQDEADRMIADVVRRAIIAACGIAGSQITQVSTQHIQALDAVKKVANTAWQS